MIDGGLGSSENATHDVVARLPPMLLTSLAIPILASAMETLLKISRCVALVAAVLLGVTALFWFVLGGAVIAAYSYYFSTLVAYGGLNPWLARAIGIVFAAAIFVGVRVGASFRQNRRAIGASVLVGSVVAFNLVVYFFNKQVVTEAQQPAVRIQAAEAQEQDKKLQEQRWRETYVTDLPTLTWVEQKKAVIVAVKSIPNNSDADLIRGHLAQLLQDQGRAPILTVFKPAFHSAPVFDDVWQGDRRVLKQLGLLDAEQLNLLLAKVELEAPTKTDFEGFVSVQGKLSIQLLSEHGIKGPVVYTMAGAGTNATTAAANCAKRLVGMVDIAKFLPE